MRGSRKNGTPASPRTTDKRLQDASRRLKNQHRMNVQVGSGLGTDLDPIWSPCWDHFGTMLGHKMRSKKCFKKSAPPDSNEDLLTCQEPPGQPPPLFARSNLQLNSFGQVSLSLSLSCLCLFFCLCLKPTWTGVSVSVSVSVSVLSLSLSLSHLSDMLQLSVEKESLEASVDC